MKGKGFKSAVFSAVMGLVVLGIAMSPVFGAEEPKFIKIAASSMGGTWFPLCAATAEVLNNNVEGTTFTATLGGGISNIKNIEAGNIYMGLGTSSSTYLASKGLSPFTEKVTKVRSVGVYYTYPYNLVVRADSEIHSIKDLEGKNLGVGKKGWSTEQFMRVLLKVYGMSYDSIKAKGGHITFAGWSQMRSMFKNKKLDFIIDPSNPPSPGIMEITALTPVRLLDIGPEAIAKVKKENPGYSTVEIPGGMYSGQEKNVVCVGDPTGMYISSEISEDLAYNITKAIFNNTEDISKVHKVLQGMSVSKALEGLYLPLHPGAYKYFKEKDLPVPEHLKP
jgi:TRAP transporter TAXI family solute receptor